MPFAFVMGRNKKIRIKNGGEKAAVGFAGYLSPHKMPRPKTIFQNFEKKLVLTFLGSRYLNMYILYNNNTKKKGRNIWPAYGYCSFLTMWVTRCNFKYTT
ncbi:hypothetical protein OUZ56_013852 [Daphnia magna]|uniref:Uncharacterized protein n=1 Tax=Daphnia magna TaxID=35525 RepID=A0ABQ9Z748_9CRUS|nr:hypothetical protein OUZ56_013852 [Daphnia magna]